MRLTKLNPSWDFDAVCCNIQVDWRGKASLIYKRTKNLPAIQLLLGHTKLDSTVRYLGVEVDDALEVAKQTRYKIISCN